MHKKNFIHLPWIAWTIAISVLSFLPGDRIPKIDFELFSLDTAVHIIMYTVLAIFLLHAFQNRKLNQFDIRVYLFLTICGIVFGFLVELIQGNFIHRRFFAWDDVIANVAGTIIGAVSYAWISRN